MNFTKEQLEDAVIEISQLSEQACCYVHKKTLQVVVLPEESVDEYFLIKPPTSKVLFDIIDRFIQQLPIQHKAGEKLRNLIYEGINRSEFDKLAIENRVMDWFSFYNTEKFVWAINELESTLDFKFSHLLLENTSYTS